MPDGGAVDLVMLSRDARIGRSRPRCTLKVSRATTSWVSRIRSGSVGRSLRPPSGAWMCFSPEADFVGGVLVGGVGIATLAEARHKREIPLLALPLSVAR